MRKIEQWMCNTIQSQRLADSNKLKYEGLTNTQGNTMVCTRIRSDYVAVTTVYLHGNMIAQYSGDAWGFKMAGWATPTTKSRINAIAESFGREGVYTKAGKHYSGDKEVNAHDWF